MSENNICLLLDILKIGTSAGGARAKAVIAYNPITGEVRSRQAEAPKGYTHWLIKFDGYMTRNSAHQKTMVVWKWRTT